MLQTWNNCCGRLDNKMCPYKARLRNDKNQFICNMHSGNLNIKTPKRKKTENNLVSWMMSLCDICTNAGEVKMFTCHKHKYCDKCYSAINESSDQTCPICLSLDDYVS